jgi:H+/Cl- antiporter ClcA
MKKHLAEQGTLFVSILKWSAFASVVGVIVGYSTTAFLKALDYAVKGTAGFHYYYLLLPAALFAGNLISQFIDKEAAGEGLDKVIDSVHMNNGKIRLRVAPAKFLASIVTIAGGGSAGKEAPPVQVGAAITSSLARLLKLDGADRRKLVICSISAGFASVFGAPIAGAIFGIESLFLGQLTYEVLFPSFVSGIVAYQVSLHHGITYFSKEITVVPVFTGGIFLKVVFAGMVFGLVSLVFIEAMKLSGKGFGRLKLPFALKGALAGLVLALLTMLMQDGRYLGLGLDSIGAAVQGQHVPAGSFLAKILFTSITLGSGASGGIITPLFFVGSASGSYFGGLFGLDPATFAAIGMVAVLAGAANTPISASILAMELFGVKIGPWAATACVVSYLMVGTRSMHSSQVVAGLKSASIIVPMNKKVGEAQTSVQPRERGMIDIARRIYRGRRR